MRDPKIIVALDFADIELARAFVAKVDPSLCRLKVGMQMFTQYGPFWIEELQNKGFDIFLDLKFHDIPTTVAKACVSAARLGVWMCNVHACGGKKMMSEARDAVDALNLKRSPHLIAVTVLTSFNESQYQQAGFADPIEQSVNRYTLDAFESGFDGVVCSALEAQALKRRLPSMLTVTPGIRLQGDASDDQNRVVTPELAFDLGADYLVMGRSITKAENPCEILTALAANS